jgi:hypothetical protein
MTKKQAAKKMRAYLVEKEKGRRAYQRADQMLAELAAEIGAGEVMLADKQKAVIVDRFAEKDIVWTPCAARRWEVKVVEAVMA